jgi:hypothetical protein
VIEFPKMLFRLGDEIELEGLKLATYIVQSAEHEAQAVVDGWRKLEDVLTKQQAKVTARKAKVSQ